MRDDLVRIEISEAAGVFAVRQTGRQAAAALHLTVHDQVRVATALSEIGRELFSHSGGATAAFMLDRDGEPALVIEFDSKKRPGAEVPREGIQAATRLVDHVEEDGTGDRPLIRVRKNLPAAAAQVTAVELARLRTRLRGLYPVSALEELRTQNAELIDALEEARRKREELRLLNAELEETNHGVMALYTELSDELEKTNRGVVALYAELDEKTDQLREAGEAKNRFWASISHELRTPVNSIIGLARLLLDPGADPLHDEQRRQISLINDTGMTLLSLVNELLDMAKAERGHLEPQPAAADTGALMRQLSALLAPMAKRSGPELVVDAAGTPPVLVTDEVMLTRVLRNLLVNGLKFTDDGEVRLTARSVGDRVEFTVRDTGRGIPPDDLERVFEEFYQVPDVKTEGTGLGLPYARHLARLLGGDLTLDSAVGEGTTATLWLPKRPPPPDEHAATPDEHRKTRPPENRGATGGPQTREER
ncbi:HAMP domain-containing histidine kinase [Actinomadura sp. KC345]|uniref:ATP-binding protein n=1 Tax=Actinomadura sp. KC345 TaxID=2530371 RepID=UPI001045A929|nr:sensor histidine kinase [Actinomadura sp. KC345]TDC57267.1 HAMP domain-containing histidine kinase [Actinomadura sp. KC345]